MTGTIALLTLCAVLATPPARAGLMDAIKKKATDKANAEVEKATGDKKPTASEKPAGDAATPAGKADGATVSSVSTKFDYVPGDSVLFMDDFTQDDLGEFPARWQLKGGTFEVAEMNGERWLRCTSVDGHVRMKVPASLPEFWTLEFDFHGEEPMSSALTVRGLAATGSDVWGATFPQGKDLAFRNGEFFSSTPLEGTVPGRHHVMFMARGTALKVYVDRQRMANVPDVTAPGQPAEIEIRLWASTGPMITNVRFAEGCKPKKDPFADGPLVTHGIHFATGSDVVMPESAPVLRQVAAYLEANAAVRLRITGHTDNVGQAGTNLDLSKRRAASVADVLTRQFGVASGRFETDGKGDTQPVSSNGKPEGRAMNRRVEFAKL
jgi:outer membrane protein OmpA-like peptidoglycan-associated protein